MISIFSKDFFKCQKLEQYVENLQVCDGKIDCVDRTDESNCLQPSNVKYEEDVFEHCTIDLNNNYKNHSKVDYSGFKCTQDICLDWNIWCSSKTFKHVEFMQLSEHCPELIGQIESTVLCSNQSFWANRPCNGKSVHCDGNYPGQCRTAALQCFDKSDIYRGYDGAIKKKQDQYTKLKDCDRVFRRRDQRFDLSKISNYSICDTTTGCITTGYLNCSQSDQCYYIKRMIGMHEALFCDGNIDCFDISDEDQDFCRKCPRQFGYPLGKADSATFSCRHRYTKRWICAVPCDGIDDLCENFEDENCSINSTWFTSAVLITLLLLTIVFGETIGRLERGLNVTVNNEETEEDLKELFHLLSKFKQMHKTNSYDEKLEEVLTAKLRHRSSIAKIILKLEFIFHREDWAQTILCLKNNFGTNKNTQLLISSLKSGSGSIPKMDFSKIIKIFQSKKMIKSKYLTSLCRFTATLFKIVFHYLDLIKDMFLLILISTILDFSNSFATFGIQIWFLVLLSIALPQFILLCTLFWFMIHKQLETKTGLLLSSLSVLIPAIGLYLCQKSDRNLHIKFKTNSSLLWLKLYSIFKMIESTFENSIQILILLFVILLKSTTATKTIHGIVEAISNEDIGFLLLSSLWSFISITLSEIRWQASLKNHFLPIKGKLILGFHFILAVLCRISAVILFFTPSMGLLNILQHWKMGQLEVLESRLKYEVFENETVTNLIDVWQKIESPSNLTIWSLQTCYIIFIAFLLFHQMFVFLIKCFNVANFTQRKDKFKKFFYIITQFFCPKIYQDWDEHVSTFEDVEQRYQKVKKELKALLMLFTLENVFMCTPIWILSYNIYQRNIFLDKFFAQLDEEIWSTKLSFALSLTCPIVFITSPFVQFWLFDLYNKNGHPWCMLRHRDLPVPNLLLAEDSDLNEILKTLNSFRHHEEDTLDAADVHKDDDDFESFKEKLTDHGCEAVASYQFYSTGDEDHRKVDCFDMKARVNPSDPEFVQNDENESDPLELI